MIQSAMEHRKQRICIKLKKKNIFRLPIYVDIKLKHTRYVMFYFPFLGVQHTAVHSTGLEHTVSQNSGMHGSFLFITAHCRSYGQLLSRFHSTAGKPAMSH